MIYDIYPGHLFFLGEAVFLHFISIGRFHIIAVRFREYHNIGFFILDLQIVWIIIV